MKGGTGPNGPAHPEEADEDPCAAPFSSEKAPKSLNTSRTVSSDWVVMRTPENRPEPVVLSFIVPAHDEEDLLPRTLASLDDAIRVLADRCEIVLVDDASTDRTSAIAKDFGARVVSVDHRQISRTRNSGARAASGDFLIFVDADSVVSARLIRSALVAMRRGAVGGGSRIKFDGSVPRWGRAIEWLSNHVSASVGFAPGSFLFCTRRAFEEAGGFDETLFGAEEAAFRHELGKLGDFVCLREEVITSGRKVRAYSAREVLGSLFRLRLRPSRLRSAESPELALWYGDRRPDPEKATLAL